jgi:Sec7-like guanine-nucleotide exchange factor
MQYLSRAEGVSKTALGDYLGEAGDFSVEVLKAFTALQDFTNKGVLEVYLYFAIW